VLANSQKIDSFASKIDSSEKKLQKITQEFDSLQNKKNLDEFLRPIEERDEKLKTQTIIYIALGAAFLAVIIFGLVRRRKKAKMK